MADVQKVKLEVDARSAGDELPASASGIDRREAIRRVSFLLGGAGFLGSSALLTACETVDRPAAFSYEPMGSFTGDDIALLDEMAETILPETDTPGAKAAAVGPFVALMVTDVTELEDRAIFEEGIRSLRELTRAEYEADFLELDPASRLTLVERLDAEALAHHEAMEDGDPPHWFRIMKNLTMLGYFTSEIGCRQAQQWVEAPGRYDPCAPYTPGDPAWASNS